MACSPELKPPVLRRSQRRMLRQWCSKASRYFGSPVIRHISTRPCKSCRLSQRGRGVWKEGRWQVVIARALRIDTKEPVAQIDVGATTGFAVAVWDGASSERGGIKAFSGDWRELVLDATNVAKG